MYVYVCESRCHINTHTYHLRAFRKGWIHGGLQEKVPILRGWGVRDRHIAALSQWEGEVKFKVRSEYSRRWPSFHGVGIIFQPEGMKFC
eukprot:1337900-Amorphochlora_amoeboformis.AAC.1